jgi:hypothetical protein
MFLQRFPLRSAVIRGNRYTAVLDQSVESD